MIVFLSLCDDELCRNGLMVYNFVGSPGFFLIKSVLGLNLVKLLILAVVELFIFKLQRLVFCFLAWIVGMVELINCIG